MLWTPDLPFLLPHCIAAFTTALPLKEQRKGFPGWGIVTPQFENLCIRQHLEGTLSFWSLTLLWQMRHIFFLKNGRTMALFPLQLFSFKVGERDSSPLLLSPP